MKFEILCLYDENLGLFMNLMNLLLFLMKFFILFW